ncbi:MAG: ankyrin repeat domain-containing protein [Candidatus Protochlamydia sp.]|nr:ankyrin repeat domain-containing protein [Candidatus Protochlamydia sp.]
MNINNAISSSEIISSTETTTAPSLPSIPVQNLFNSQEITQEKFKPTYKTKAEKDINKKIENSATKVSTIILKNGLYDLLNFSNSDEDIILLNDKKEIKTSKRVLKSHLKKNSCDLVNEALSILKKDDNIKNYNDTCDKPLKKDTEYKSLCEPSFDTVEDALNCLENGFSNSSSDGDDSRPIKTEERPLQNAIHLLQEALVILINDPHSPADPKKELSLFEEALSILKSEPLVNVELLNTIENLILKLNTDVMVQPLFHKCYFACLSGEFEYVKKLIDDKPDLITLFYGKEGTLFHACAISNRLEIMKWLDSIIPDCLNRCRLLDGKNVMHIASEQGNLAMVKWLSSKHVLLDKSDKQGCTPLHLAALNEKIEILKEFPVQIAEQKETFLFVIAGKKNCPVSIQYLFDENLQPDLNSLLLKINPLHLAAQAGLNENVKCLLKNKVDINSQDDQGRTPIFFAAMKHFSTVRLLIENQADITYQNLQKQTLLHVAAAYDQPQILEELLKKNSCKKLINTLDDRGQSPLHSACWRKEKLSILSLLIQNDANTFSANKQGNTPLHLAAQHGFLETAKILLADQKQDTAELANDKNLLPFDLAILFNQDAFIEFFLRKQGFHGSLPLMNEIHTDSSTITNESQLLTDTYHIKKFREKAYLNSLLKAKKDKDIEKQIIYLLKISTLYIENAKENLERGRNQSDEGVVQRAKIELERALIEGTKIVNGALALLNKNNNLFEQYLFKKLKIIENIFVNNLSKTNIPRRKNSPLKGLLDKSNSQLLPKFFAQNEAHQIKDKRFLLMEARNADRKSGLNIKSRQEKMTEKFKGLLSLLVNETEDLFKAKFQVQLPKWACFAIGAAARGEMFPYSPMQFSFLIDGEKEHFEIFLKLLEIKINNLGESNYSIVEEGVEGVYKNTAKGFSTDFHNMVRIYTPKKLAKFQSSKSFLKEFNIVTYIAGDKALIESYNETKKKYQNRVETSGRRNKDELAIQLFVKNSNFHFHSLNKESVNIRKELFLPFEEIIECLSIWFNIDKSNIFERIDEMIGMKLIHSDLNLKGTIEKIMSLLLKSHHYSKKKKEWLFYDMGQKGYTLGGETVNLEEYFKVLQNLTVIAQNFYNHKFS